MVVEEPLDDQPLILLPLPLPLTRDSSLEPCLPCQIQPLALPHSLLGPSSCPPSLHLVQTLVFIAPITEGAHGVHIEGVLSLADACCALFQGGLVHSSFVNLRRMCREGLTKDSLVKGLSFWGGGLVCTSKGWVSD